MIRAVLQAEPAFFTLLNNSPVFGMRIATLHQCYREYPSLSSFYWVGEQAVMSLTGQNAIIAGTVNNWEELNAFIRFWGVREIEIAHINAAFIEAENCCVKELCLMVYEPKKTEALPKCSFTLGEPLIVWEILKDAGVLFQKNAFYADYCMRRNRGSCVAYVAKENGKAVSTAGIYAMNDTEAYIACVATLPQYRKKGYASALCELLASSMQDKTVYLHCEEALVPLYEKAGFSIAGKTMRVIRGE